jgi:hypothetical protein
MFWSFDLFPFDRPSGQFIPSDSFTETGHSLLSVQGQGGNSAAAAAGGLVALAALPKEEERGGESS